jgi:hypothetical protein
MADTKEQTGKTEVSVKVPFAGLYNSIHDSMIDIAMEGINQDADGDEDAIIGIDNVRWAEVHLAYVQIFLKKVVEETGVPMRFEKMISPRDYSMGNDQIIAKTPLEGIKTMFSGMDKEQCDAWRARVTEEMTARPGFIPYSKYSDDADDWGPIEMWDEAQRDLFIDFHVSPMFDGSDIAQDISDQIDDLIWRAVIDPNIVPGHVDNQNEESVSP